MSLSTKFFPWSPGIPWQLKNGKYVVPQLPVSLFHSILKKKDVVVCAFGGLLESFYSFSVIEAINHEIPGNKIWWQGNEEYSKLVYYNGIARSFNQLTFSDTERFTTPIFLDKNNRVYFNALYNCIDVKSYYLTGGYKDNRPIINQIVDNATIPWDDRFLPQMRRLEISPDLNAFLNVERIDTNKPFVLLVPEDTKYSMHDQKCINWDVGETKSFIAMMSQSGIPVIVLSSNQANWSYSKAKTLPLRLDFLLPLMSKAKFFISKNVDFSIVTNAISDAIILTDFVEGSLNVEKNNQFLGNKNVIYTKKSLSPVEAWKFIAGKGCE